MNLSNDLLGESVAFVKIKSNRGRKSLFGKPLSGSERVKRHRKKRDFEKRQESLF